MRLNRLVFFGLLLCGGVACGDDWADWRGPQHNGISLETGLVETWNYESRENILWESPIGGRAAPIIMDGRVFLDCRTADDVNSRTEKVNAREQVVCRDAATGEIIWQHIFNVTQTDIPAPRVGWASMVGDTETGNVYLHSVSGIFRCYDRDGGIVWERNLLEEYGRVSGYGGRTQTPIIDEDRVIVGFFGLSWGRHGAPPPQMTYYAFNKHTGDLLWRGGAGGRPLDTNYSNPVLTVVDGQRMLIGGGADGAVVAVNARTGQEIWSYPMSKRGLNTTPVVDGHLVYISHGEDNIDSTEFGRIECIDARGSGVLTSQNSVWRVDGIKAGYSGLVLQDGILYVVADTGKLYAMDATDGHQLWEYSIGTVGKGSPTYADGKLYVMEVNGNIHILKPSREGCESLSHVALTATNGEGMDEIYGTPAISDGRVVFVTRDRTICIGNENAGKRTTHPIPALQEADGGKEIASIRIVPYEVRLTHGGDVRFTVEGLNRLGQAVSDVNAAMVLPPEADGMSIDGQTLTVAADAPSFGREISASYPGDLTAVARVRNFAPLPWSWDFEGFKPKQVPSQWVNAFLKLQPTEINGTMAMKNSPAKGAPPSANIWLGYTEMDGYTVQADVLLKEDRRKLPSAGLVVRGYNFVLVGNTSKIELNCWAPHKRVEAEKKFVSKPDTWYTMKMSVQVEDGVAHVRGKVWAAGSDEPAEWTIEVADPHPAETGGPGLFVYSLADVYFDNVSVTE